MRGDGLYRRGEVWWMTWRTPDGKRHRASTEQHYHDDAKTVRDRVAGDVASGRPAPTRCTFAEGCALIRAEYQAKGRRSMKTLATSLRRLAEFFPPNRVLGSISWG